MPLRKIKQRHLIESLFINAGVGVAVVSAEGVPIRVNKKLCDLLGYTEAELLEMHFRDFTYAEDIEKDLDLFTSLIAGEIDSYEIEKRYIRKDRNVFWGLLTVSIARQEDGTTVVMGMVQDIDARKKAEAALLESEKKLWQHNVYKDKLFSIIAHDLKGPVNGIAAALGLLEKMNTSLPEKNINAFISKLKNRASKVSGLLDDLLTWSKSQFQEINFQPSPLVILEEVEEVAAQLQILAEDKDIKLALNIPTDMKVQADEKMLHIIMRNLVSNAIKFSDTGKRISIDAVEDASFVHLSISDEGVGISNETLAKLLDCNLEGVTSYGTRGEKGTGLGINLCMKLIEKHGGSLQINSALGKGSKFTVALPAVLQM